MVEQTFTPVGDEISAQVAEETVTPVDDEISAQVVEETFMPVDDEISALQAPIMVDAVKDLCQNVNSNCSETGLQAQMVDSLHVAPVPLLPRESNLVDPKCDRATSLAD